MEPHSLPQTRARIIIGNLLRNALQYSDEGVVEIVVRDRSLLISNPIGAAQGTDESMAFGYGLGLDLVQRLCQKSGWRLHYSSDEQRFRCELLFPATRTEARRPSSAQNRGRGRGLRARCDSVSEQRGLPGLQLGRVDQETRQAGSSQRAPNMFQSSMKVSIRPMSAWNLIAEKIQVATPIARHRPVNSTALPVERRVS